MELQENTNRNGRGFGIVALVCGIISVFISFVPCMGIFGMPFSISAIVFGIVSMVRARKAKESSGMAVAGITTGGVALIVSIAWLVVIVKTSNNGINMNKFWNPNVSMFMDINDLSCDFESADFDTRDTTLERLATVLNDMDGDRVCISANDSTFTLTVEDGESKVTIGTKKKQNTVTCNIETSDSE